MDKEEALMESNLDLASNAEILTPFEDKTNPSIEEALDETNSRVTNPSKILNTQIGDEDDINERGNYSITISLKPCSYETSPNQLVSPTSPHSRSPTPLFFLVTKTSKGWL
jgi:hypothetical protein